MVILPMVNQYSRMLQRNLLYTAVTRSQQYLIMCGEAGAFQKSATTIPPKRATFLQEFLTNFDIEKTEETPAIKENKTEPSLDDTVHLDEGKEIQLTIQAIEEGLISPMIGMDDVTPYDFMTRS